jgi:diguanylate cyclase (GGDEF)-like protein
MGRAPTASTWLCPTEADRERLLDMEERLKRVRQITFALMLAGLLVTGHWLGWWPVAACAFAAVAFGAADVTLKRIAHPERSLFAAWVLSEIVIAAAIALTGGPRSPAVAWLAIPVVTLGARFRGQAVLAGVLLAADLMIAATVGVHPGEVAQAPQLLVLPLVLLVAVGVLSTALMDSDLQHRGDSVLDGLTGMLNRRALAARVAELTQQAELTGEPIGLLIADLDQFKAINDEHGHSVGDSVLVDVAYAIRKQLRAFDLAYRLGGEEFLVLLPGADLPATVEVAERLRESVATTPAGGLRVTMSVGAVCSGAAGFDYPALFAVADAALYAAKAAGRNRVHAPALPAHARAAA